MKTGIQVSSVKALLKTAEEVRLAFSRMAAMGCRYVQLQWIDPSVSPSDVARALTDAGLSSIGVQDFYQTVSEKLDYYLRLNRATGGKSVTVSRIPERLKSRAGLDVFAAELRQLQGQLDAWGQTLHFHPVAADFAAVPGMDAVAYLMDAMPEMEICLDLYHLNRSCADMPGFVRRYAGRIPTVHFKDERDGALVPAGSGTVRYGGVVTACREAGVLYGLVEQESWEGDPYLALGEGLAWLRAQL